MRYLIYVKFNKSIKSNGIVLVQKNVNLRVELGGEIVFGKNVLIKEGSIIYAKKGSKITIGKNSSTGHHTEISANNYIQMGNDIIMGAYTYITDSNHGYKDSTLPIRKQPMESGKVIIEDNVWLGRNVMVLKDTNIGNNSIVSAGSIVTKEFKNNVILAGIPAKIIKGIYE